MTTQRGAQPGTNTGAGSTGGGVVDQAKSTVQQLAGQAREQTTQQVGSGLARGKTQAAATLSGVAQALLQSAQPLRDQHQPGAGQYVEQAAAQVLRLSNYLQNTDVHEIVDGVERAARRQPALFLGGTFALGLLGARFFKNSRREYRQQQSGAPMGHAAAPTTGGAYAGAYGTGYGTVGGSPLGTSGAAGR